MGVSCAPALYTWIVTAMKQGSQSYNVKVCQSLHLNNYLYAMLSVLLCFRFRFIHYVFNASVSLVISRLFVHRFCMIAPKLLPHTFSENWYWVTIHRDDSTRKIHSLCSIVSIQWSAPVSFCYIWGFRPSAETTLVFVEIFILLGEPPLFSSRFLFHFTIIIILSEKVS